jgi:hypothetical protein
MITKKVRYAAYFTNDQIVFRRLLTGPSVTRFTHNKCIAVNGSGTPESVANNIAKISPILHEIKKQIKACMFA